MIHAPMRSSKSVDCLDLLIVDDNDLTLEIIAWSLRDTDISYQLCSEATEALQVLSKIIPHMLIVDYHMPKVDGLELLEQFNQLPQSNTCATFLCTSAYLVPDQLTSLSKLGVQLIDKDQLCNKESLLNLVLQPGLAVNG